MFYQSWLKDQYFSSGTFTLNQVPIVKYRENQKRFILTSHFLVVHLSGIENGPVWDRNLTSPSKSSLICKIVSY